MRRHSSSLCVTGYVLLSIRRSSIADQPAPLRSSVAPSPRCRQWTLCRNQHRYGYKAASRLGAALQLGIPRRRTLGGDSAISPDRPHRPSLALDPGQSVLDPGLRPGAPRHGEELEPLLDVEVRVHPGRDEIHSGGDAVLRGSRRDFIERSLIDVALVVEWHPQLDRKIGRADQQDVDAWDRGNGIEVLQRLVRLDHRHDNELVVHGVEVIAVILELTPLAAHPGIAAVAEGKIAAGTYGGLRLRAGVDHRHDDASCPGVKRE